MISISIAASGPTPTTGRSQTTVVVVAVHPNPMGVTWTFERPDGSVSSTWTSRATDGPALETVTVQPIGDPGATSVGARFDTCTSALVVTSVVLDASIGAGGDPSSAGVEVDRVAVLTSSVAV